MTESYRLKRKGPDGYHLLHNSRGHLVNECGLSLDAVRAGIFVHVGSAYLEYLSHEEVWDWPDPEGDPEFVGYDPIEPDPPVAQQWANLYPAVWDHYDQEEVGHASLLPQHPGHTDAAPVGYAYGEMGPYYLGDTQSPTEYDYLHSRLEGEFGGSGIQLQFETDDAALRYDASTHELVGPRLTVDYDFHSPGGWTSLEVEVRISNEPMAPFPTLGTYGLLFETEGGGAQVLQVTVSGDGKLDVELSEQQLRGETDELYVMIRPVHAMPSYGGNTMAYLLLNSTRIRYRIRLKDE